MKQRYKKPVNCNMENPISETTLRPFNQLREYERKFILAYVCDFINYDVAKYEQLVELLLSWESDTPPSDKFILTISDILKTPTL